MAAPYVVWLISDEVQVWLISDTEQVWLNRDVVPRCEAERGGRGLEQDGHRDRTQQWGGDLVP